MENTLERILVCLILMGVAVFGTPAHKVLCDSLDQELSEIHGGARLVTCEGFIMAVARDRKILIVKEKQIVVGPYRLAGRVGTTRLRINKKRANLDAFRPGNWVAIRGYEVSKERIHARSVQHASGYLPRDHRRIGALRIDR